jgi:hypothetical protein
MNKEHSMRDFFNNELAVGDRVALTPHGYKSLVVGWVVGFTPQMVKVSYARRIAGKKDAVVSEILRKPKDVIKDLTGGWGNDGQGV